MGFANFDEHTLLVLTRQFTDAAFPAFQDFSAPGNLAARVDSVVATNDDTIAHTILVGISDGTTEWWMGTATIPIGAGHAGVPSVDVLALALPATTQWLFATELVAIRLRLGEAMSAGKLLNVALFGGAF